jgi:hypothetical protein
VITIYSRNVNDALERFKQFHDGALSMWRTITVRGGSTKEAICPVTTVYSAPNERVLFNVARDANPFFHFFESLWILAGRDDVAYLAQFNPRMADYSDDGHRFHAAYGYRLRKHFAREGSSFIQVVDQLEEVISLLKRDRDTRRAVLSIWDPVEDLNADSKDIPCNDLIMFKIRDGKLEMTVCCRSNDVIWGAYGTNAVQFSMVQEVVARAVGVGIGPYRQVSDSYHVYLNEPAYQRTVSHKQSKGYDPYREGTVKPYPLFEGPDEYGSFMRQLERFVSGSPTALPSLPFFSKVAGPMLDAWKIWKSDHFKSKNERIDHAVQSMGACEASDWKAAGMYWLLKRKDP